MTVYPISIDDDQTIIRIDDNLSELGTEVINQIRSAVFAIEAELGINPSGSLNSVADRLNVALNPNGTIRSSALTSVGLATLPIDDAQVGANAGIKESKIALDYTTADLYALIVSNTALANSTAAFAATTNADLLLHISGGVVLSDGSTRGRHFDSQIDLENPLVDRDGNDRTATTVAEALIQINNEFVAHQLDQSGDAHFASGIFVDTSNFLVLPKNADTVQKSLEAIDEADTLVIQQHQANLHSNGVPSQARTTLIGDIDGYSYTILPETAATALLDSSAPNDNNTTGDDVILFIPDSDGYIFDAKFEQVKIGDTVRINYGTGIEGVFNIESKRHIPGTEWAIRINGINLDNAPGGTALVKIDRRRFDTNKYGTLAIAPANNDVDLTVKPSVVIGNPRAAQTLGIAFDAAQLDSSHYLLYLAYYPNGNPDDGVVELPAIDVTGDLGASPGSYTLQRVVKTTNDSLRAAGYNYRFIAFERDGEFGIMMADAIENASFSIINGELSSGSIVEGSYTNNVVGDATDNKDALGFGIYKSQVASPVYTGSYDSPESAISFPTTILRPFSKKNFVVNGISRDDFADTYMATDGYWDGYISERTVVGVSTIEVTYHIPLDLSPAGLKAGKTITIQPDVDRGDSLFNEADYGRFIIKDVAFSSCCPTDEPFTEITVVSGVHGTGDPIWTTSEPPLPVRLYFGEDSVSFNDSNVIDSTPTGDYNRYHEIFINEDGETFSHERARMPIQVQTTTLLNTTGWMIHNVSAKLKGYLDDSAMNLNKYVRFYVLNYNSISGEYDGYIGKKDSASGITDFGRVVTARKNTPTRFYDASDVDYVELEFREFIQEPGTTIIPGPRFVDIEIFDSLALNQENFRLGSCNVVENEIINCVNDLREFGNVSETDFTDSAIRFIESGDRHLHANGVIDGFEYVTEVDGVLTFNGGIALVNGHMSTLSSQSISIPQIIENTGGGTNDTINWGVCVNDKDLLEVIPVTPTKQHFFAQEVGGSNNYYIPSVTFDELISKRKDLTLIYIANVTVASITVNSVTDARKFVQNETAAIPLSISDNPETSTFTSFEQVIAWCSNTDLNNVVVDVSSDFTIDSEVDLTSISNLTLRGDGGSVIVTSENGFIVKDGVTFDGVEFVYNNTLSFFNSGDLAHLSNQQACIKIEDEASNINILDCKFRQGVSGERNPYIGHFSTYSSDGIENIKIERNTFEESSNSFNCAVGFCQYWDPGTPFYERIPLTNVSVSDNKIEGAQSILFAYDITPFKPARVIVDKNSAVNGFIGFALSDTDQTSGFFSEANRSIDVSNNNCKAIFLCGPDGKSLHENGQFMSANGCSSFISNNSCLYIEFAPEEKATVADNYILSQSTDVGLLEVVPEAADAAVRVFGNGTINIINNKITDLSSGINGILASAQTSSSDGYSLNGIISGNRIERASLANISSFIDVSNSVSGELLIVDNNLNSTTNVGVGPVDRETIKYDPDNHVVSRNINYVNDVRISGRSGTCSVADASLINGTFSNEIDNVNSSSIGTTFVIGASPAGSATGKWGIPLREMMPDGAYLRSVEFTLSTTSLISSWTSLSGIISLLDEGFVQVDSLTTDLKAEGLSTKTVTFTPTTVVRNGGELFFSMSGLHVNAFATPMSVTFVTISYTF